jgi:hypothetical protein
MKPWNKIYKFEARAIAASVVREGGYRWKAGEIMKGARDGGDEVQIAMRALMIAGGEYELKKPW